MAEFSEVCKQWRRMCESHICPRKGKPTFEDMCPIILQSRHFSCSIPIEHLLKVEEFVSIEHLLELEEIVMEWAAEHPEPVYPSIAKYLEQFGIIIRRDGILEANFFKANEPMNADIAQKLGLEPKDRI